MCCACLKSNGAQREMCSAAILGILVKVSLLEVQACIHPFRERLCEKISCQLNKKFSN